MQKPASPAKHIVTEAEWKYCESLGFVSFTPGVKTSLIDFINANFPGLELYQFLSEIGILLNPMSAKKLTKTVSCNDNEPYELVIQYYGEDHDDDINGLALSRTLIKDQSGKTAIHDFFRIPKTFRNQGHGKTMLKYGLQQYLNVGVDLIKVHAALADGGYVWAKAHFLAVKRHEVSLILAAAKLNLKRKDFEKVKDVYDNYYSQEPNGKAFPINKWSNMPEMEDILRNSNWHGEIDLNNPELLTKFINYVTGQK